MTDEGQFNWDPPESDADSPADAFVRLACNDYADWHPSRAEKARRMLAEHPELARASIYTAATAGDSDAVREMLAAEPALANTKGGALRWEPLLYACYSRIGSTLDAARVLLEHGADPNAGFLWRGNVPPFTALTGAFGAGEGGAAHPPHQQHNALVRLLLDAGADPNDGQTLYNLHFKRDDDHLKLLFEYGLGEDKAGPWFQRFGDRLQTPARMLAEELWSGARKNYPERVRLLVEHGTDVNTPGVRDGRTPYEAARRAGNDDIAEYLLEQGAKRIELGLHDAFAAACINGRRNDAMALLAKHPKLLEEIGHHGRVELLHRAVEVGRPDGIRLMASLGFELSETTTHDCVGINLAATPLHNAAWLGNLEMVRLLIELGADRSVRDPEYDGTPLDWSAYNQQQHVVDYLSSLSR